MQTTNLLPIPPTRLKRHRGDAELVYESLRLAASGRAGEVDWSRFGPVEWRLLARMAHPDAEGVGPLLYWAFRDGSWPAAMPEGVRGRLREHYYNTLANNTIRFNELKRVLAAFDRAGVPVILLKGAALAPLVYEDIGLRPMGDLDILVRPEHVRQSFEVLASIGFDLFKTTVQALFVNRAEIPVMIELHWGIIVRGSTGRLPCIDWFWDRAHPVGDLRLSNGLVLAPDAHLVYLIGHQYLQHEALLGRLIWLHDMDLLLQDRDEPIAEQELDQVFSMFGWEKGLRQFRREIDEQIVHSNAYRRPAGVVQDPDEDVVRIFYSLSVLDWRMRLFLIFKILMPPVEYLRTRYTIRSRLLLPVYYLVRWVYLVRRALF